MAGRKVTVGSVQQRAEQIGDPLLLGVPTKYFESGGRDQLKMLLDQGLEPSHNVCDVGCGALRGGFWLMNLLEPGRYYGIEPRDDRMQVGTEVICGPDLIEQARPTFSTNVDFDLSVFGVNFDFVVARSVWSHAARWQIEQLLDSFVPHAQRGGVLLASAILTWGRGYTGDTWVGTSHESDVSGLVRQPMRWFRKVAADRGLRVSVVRGHRLFHQRLVRKQQKWLRIEVR